MTREEKKNALHCLKVMIDEEVCEECDLYGTTGTDHCEADCVRVAIKALEQEPCEDVAKERYEDLCEYFGGAKDILKNREDFKAWLYRIKWHIHKAEELSAENDDLRDQLDMRDRFQKREPCEDAISRQTVKMQMIKYGFHAPDMTVTEFIEDLPSVNPQPKTVHWILQPSNKEQGERDFIWWKCSECGQVIYSETEKDRREFHAFCSRCGAKMVDPQESEG